METLLPSNSTPLQQALAQVSHQNLNLDANLLRRSKRPDQCTAELLPWLAWENSIGDAEGWRFAENEQQRRRLIKDYILKHALKGTPSVIRQLFRDMQLGEIDIVERVQSAKWDGLASFNGDYYFSGEQGDWACYGIKIYRPITNEQADILRVMLVELAPARCRLIYLSYRDTPLYWDGEINFNGSYNYGAVT